MIESVNKQLFKQYTDCVRATLETPAAAATTPGPSPTPPSAPSVAAGPEPGIAAAPSALATPVAATASTPAPAVGAYAPPSSAAAPATQPAGPPATAPLAKAEPVRLLPIVVRALWENALALLRALWRIVMRLFGRK
jgi:hypothetical protein